MSSASRLLLLLLRLLGQTLAQPQPPPPPPPPPPPLAAYRAAAVQLHARGEYHRAARVWRRLLVEHGEANCSAADLRSLGRTCLALMTSGQAPSSPSSAARCAELAFAVADGRSEQDAKASSGAGDGDGGCDGDGDGDGGGGVLSAACPHIRRADVAFLMPHVTVGNSSWRSLFNTEAAPSAASQIGPSSGGGKRRRKHRGKVFGLGLSKTGVTSLREALYRLGWRRTAAMGFDFYPRVLDSTRDTTEALQEYFAELDATTDLPYALFSPELLRAFPSAKFVLTTRDVHAWWRSVQRQMAAPYAADHPIGRTRTLAYGQPIPHERLYTRRFVAHSTEVLRAVPCEQLLIIDVLEGGDGWQRLAPFLGVAPPDTPFPHMKPAPTPTQGR